MKISYNCVTPIIAKITKLGTKFVSMTEKILFAMSYFSIFYTFVCSALGLRKFSSAAIFLRLCPGSFFLLSGHIPLPYVYRDVALCSAQCDEGFPRTWEEGFQFSKMNIELGFGKELDWGGVDEFQDGLDALVDVCPFLSAVFVLLPFRGYVLSIIFESSTAEFLSRSCAMLFEMRKFSST